MNIRRLKQLLDWAMEAESLLETQAYVRAVLLEFESTPDPRMMLRLESTGDRKIDVIKAIRNRLGWGLKESKDFSEVFPNEFPDSFSMADGDQFSKELREVGAEVTLRMVD